MILGLIILLIIGIIFILLGISIGIGNINLIHRYHTKNINESTKYKYLKLFSIGMYTIGIGCIIASIFGYLEYNKGLLISLFLSMLMGILIIIKAQKKYNKGIFS